MVGRGRQRHGAAAAAVVGKAVVKVRLAVGGKGMDGNGSAVAEGTTPNLDAQGQARHLPQGRTPLLSQQVGLLTKGGT